MALNVVQSQRLSVLLHALQARSLASRQSPLQMLQAQHCIVPNVAIEQWLTQQLATQQGISAHWQFHYGIRSFQWYAYQTVLPEKDRVRKANVPRLMMKWRIYQYLQAFCPNAQLRLSPEHVLAPLLQRVVDDAQMLAPEQRTEKVHGMLYWLAEQTSKRFSHYMIYRGQCQANCHLDCQCPQNWLAQWGKGQHLDLEYLLNVNARAPQQQAHKSEPSNSQLSNSKLSQTTNSAPSDPDLQLKTTAPQTLLEAQRLEAWQAHLWQELFHQDWLETQRIDQQFWQQLNAHEPTAALAALPPQLTLFTLSELAPTQLYFLRRLAQHLDILILHFNPSQEYWADTVDPRWKQQYDLGVKQRYLKQHPQANDAEIDQFFAQFTLNFNAELRESRHPLLTRFGKQARDQFSQLANLAAGDEGHWVDAFVDEKPQHILGQLQHDILYLNDAAENAYSLAPTDHSIQVHVCHSALRQLEVLKDQVLLWLNANPAHRPSDILVLSPQLKQIEAQIRSVFGSDPKQQGYIPIKIAGVAPQDHLLAWQAIGTRLALLQGRFQPQHLADWLSLPATMQRYGLDVAAIDRMMQLLTDAGFCRGFDAAHLQKSLDPNDHDYRFSFQFALNRLSLGMLIPEHALFADQLSFDAVVPADFELIATLQHIYMQLDERRDWLNPVHGVAPLEAHLTRVLAEIDEFIAAGVQHLQTVREQAQKLWRMFGLATVNTQSQLAALKDLSLPLQAVLDELGQNLQGQFEQAAPTGFMTFAEIGQLRPLPYQLIVILNLDMGSFPNRQRQTAFDLMQLLRPVLGDRSRLDDDQGAFLDALLLAEQALWLFYNGFDVADGEVRDPSLAVQELMSHLAYVVQHQGELSVAAQSNLDGLIVPAHLASLYRVHPLQPFDPDGFVAPHQRYQDAWYEVAQQLQTELPARRNPFVASETQLTTANDLAEPTCNNLAAPHRVIDASQWMNDVVFPARLYLKHWGIHNAVLNQDYADQEALLLDGLARHRLRDVLLQSALTTPETTIQPADASEIAALAPEQIALLQDQLPVGKMQQAAVRRAAQELQQLLLRMQPFATTPTPTTQQTWQFLPDLYFNVTVPARANTTEAWPTDWVSVHASAGRGRRKVLLWLEYLFYCLWYAEQQHPQQQSQQQSHPHAQAPIQTTALRRIAVFNDVTVVCEGVNAQQAQQYLNAWWQAAQYAQQQPLVLPAELLMQLAKPNEIPEWQENNSGQKLPKNFADLLKHWRNAYAAPGVDFRDKQDSRYHRDWQFLLQCLADDALLQEACAQFAYDLYQPIFCHLKVN